jgi:hypothetical protein
VKRIINIIAASVSVVPGFLLPGTGIWYYLVLQGALYTTFSEIGFYCSAVRPPPDVVSGYTKVSPFVNITIDFFRKKKSEPLKKNHYHVVDTLRMASIFASRPGARDGSQFHTGDSPERD